MNRAMVGRLVLVLFALSGVAGLIYQSIWSQYLGLLLGHAAYAQTLVLAIFMGGMALGAWLASRWSERWRQLFRAYAVAELLIGLLGLGFHAMFLWYSDFALQTLLPGLGGGAWSSIAQWLGAGLLIAPQSVLLGMTFPLMCSAFLRLAPGQDGEVLGGLYFANSLGAAAGALLATFLIMPMIGLPGTVATAGVLNILVAGIAWFIAVDGQTLGQLAIRQAAPRSEGGSRLFVPLLAATFLSGAASFVYEVSWIRMLNQVLGTSIHSFELMLAAFILGLALGGWWVRRRGHGIGDPLLLAGWAQVLMGIAALLSLLAFSQSFGWMASLIGALARNDAGYALFASGSALMAMAIMLPAAFFAGTTLPLFTMALLRSGEGERAIGRVYAANTLGAIVGVLLCVHVLIPAFGVRMSLIGAAMLDILVGLVLLRRYVVRYRPSVLIAASVCAVLALIIGVTQGRVDPLVSVAGVYRTGTVGLGENSRVFYLRDGKTATVSVYSQDMPGATIATNGKPDASLSASLDLPPTMDEVTMAMLGVMPLMFHPAPSRIAFVGWGSGMSTHTVLGSDLPQHVDTIEIESAIVEGSRIFGKRVERAFNDPRSHLQLDDARKYFATYRSRYQAIVSEPSNPWVSGVAGLFTREFYALARGALTDDGVFVQWLHNYEISDALVATMIAALLEEFPEVRIYASNWADFILVAAQQPLQMQDVERLGQEPLHTELRRVGLGNADEFALRYIGGRRVLDAFVAANAAVPHSDFFPVVSLQAPQTRFSRSSSGTLQALVDNGLPVLEMLEGRLPVPDTAELVVLPENRFGLQRLRAAAVVKSLAAREVSPELVQRDGPLASVLGFLMEMSRRPISEAMIPAWSAALDQTLRASLGLLPADDLASSFGAAAWINAIDEQPPVVLRSLASVRALAMRDAEAMRSHCSTSIRSDLELLAPQFRATLAFCVVLGDIGASDLDAAAMSMEGLDVLVAGDSGYVQVWRLVAAWLKSS